MASWKIEFSNEANKQYKKLPEAYKKNIDKVFEKLVRRELLDIKPVAGEKDVFRIRVGRYRVLFKEIIEGETYLVFRISTRGGAYK